MAAAEACGPEIPGSVGGATVYMRALYRIKSGGGCWALVIAMAPARMNAPCLIGGLYAAAADHAGFDVIGPPRPAEEGHQLSMNVFQLAVSK